MGFCKILHVNIFSVFKDRGPGMNSSQLKNVGKIQFSMQLSHLRIICEIYGFNDYNKF